MVNIKGMILLTNRNFTYFLFSGMGAKSRWNPFTGELPPLLANRRES